LPIAPNQEHGNEGNFEGNKNVIDFENRIFFLRLFSVFSSFDFGSGKKEILRLHILFPKRGLMNGKSVFFCLLLFAGVSLQKRKIGEEMKKYRIIEK
jgi:hypothetical protein